MQKKQTAPNSKLDSQLLEFIDYFYLSWYVIHFKKK